MRPTINSDAEDLTVDEAKAVLGKNHKITKENTPSNQEVNAHSIFRIISIAFATSSPFFVSLRIFNRPSF